MKELDPIQVSITQDRSLKIPKPVNVHIIWRSTLGTVTETRPYPSFQDMTSRISREILLRKAQIVSGLLGVPLFSAGFFFSLLPNLDTPSKALLGIVGVAAATGGSFYMASFGILQLQTPLIIQQKIQEVAKTDFAILPTPTVSQSQL